MQFGKSKIHQRHVNIDTIASNIPTDTVQIMSETTFPANYLNGAKNDNLTGTSKTNITKAK